MFIIEMTAWELDFCQKSTETTGAWKVRTFDVNHACSLFMYYFEDHVNLTFKRYDQQETTLDDWAQFEQIGFLYPDIDLRSEKEVWMNEEHAQVNVRMTIASNERRQ